MSGPLHRYVALAVVAQDWRGLARSVLACRSSTQGSRGPRALRGTFLDIPTLLVYFAAPGGYSARFGVQRAAGPLPHQCIAVHVVEFTGWLCVGGATEKRTTYRDLERVLG